MERKFRVEVYRYILNPDRDVNLCQWSLCRELQSLTVEFPYQLMMLPVRILLTVEDFNNNMADIQTMLAEAKSN